jgi:hypothetical protein
MQQLLNRSFDLDISFPLVTVEASIILYCTYFPLYGVLFLSVPRMLNVCSHSLR